MTVDIEKKFEVLIVYNGISKPLRVQLDERVAAVLQGAIAAFGIVQNPHLLALFRENGSELPDGESVERAGLKPGEILLLRPSAVRGGNEPLHLSEGILPATFRTLRDCGLNKYECVAYWTGPVEGASVDGVEHPIHARSPFCYEIESEWLTEFWKQLALSGRRIKAQVHTHPGRAFHSKTDDDWPIVSQSGFLSIVIPFFAAGEESLDNAWIGRLQSDGNWRQIAFAAGALIIP
jgi:hypothetical protein